MTEIHPFASFIGDAANNASRTQSGPSAGRRNSVGTKPACDPGYDDDDRVSILAAPATVSANYQTEVTLA